MAMTANHHAFAAVQVHEPSLSKQSTAQGVLGGSPALASFNLGCGPVSVSVKEEASNNHMQEAYAMLASVG